jgi:fatty-acyl-CoA synthase
MRPEVPRTLPGLLAYRAANTPDQRAIVLPGVEVTYQELAERAAYYAHALAGLGVAADDKVGLLMPASIDYVAAMFGTAQIGAIPVLMNARFKARELHHVITNGELTAVLTSTSAAESVDFPVLVRDALDLGEAPHLRHLVTVDDDKVEGFIGRSALDAAADRGDAAVIASATAAVTPESVGMIMYTSGTTASPKGAMLAHHALVHQGCLVADTRFALVEGDRVWTPLPLFHIGGLSYLLTCVVAGATFVHPGHFDADLALNQLRDERCTIALPAFETMWLQVLDHPDFDPDDFRALRLVLAVGVVQSLQRMQDRLPDAAMVSTFGGTESTSHLSIALADDPPATRLGTGGHPLPGIEVRIIDHQTGEAAPTGTAGEILYRGWNRFLGYYNAPETTAAAIDPDGWFHSGDLGTFDVDGRVTYVGRLKDMLKVGGENVAAAEIEGFLVTHPAVNIAQVVSAPDARYTEVPAAFVELAPGASATESELIDHCRGAIATFKVPRYVRFVTDWPMSGTKIKKYVLRERIAAELAETGIVEAPRITSS